MSNVETKKIKLQTIVTAIYNNIFAIETRKQKVIDNFNNQNFHFDENNSIEKKIYTDIYLASITELDNNLSVHTMYLERCKLFTEYASNRKEGSVSEITYRYKLTDLIQKEAISKFRDEYTLKSRLIDIDDDCLNLVNQYVLVKKEVPALISKKLLTSEKILEYYNDVKTAVKKEEEYKKLFKEESFTITDEMIEEDIFFEFKIELLIDRLYNKKDKEDEVHIK